MTSKKPNKENSILIDSWFESTKSLGVLKPHNPFKSSDVYGCRRRLVVNIYKGCGLGPCFYCFAIPYTKIKFIWNPEPKKDFKKRLGEDLKKYCQLGYPKYPVYICSSCDPFQPLEETCFLTHFTR
jgi:DNA repair photolyase